MLVGALDRMNDNRFENDRDREPDSSDQRSVGPLSAVSIRNMNRSHGGQEKNGEAGEQSGAGASQGGGKSGRGATDDGEEARQVGCPACGRRSTAAEQLPG